MSIFNRVFEVKVKVGQKTETFHFEKRTSKQAGEAGQKHGRVLSVRKVDRQALLGNIEKLDLSQEPLRTYLGSGVYEDELNIDAVLGLSKKENRRKRIETKEENRLDS